MNLKTGLSIATGTIIAGTTIGPAQEPAFAQASPMLSQAAMEQELVTAATQMAANPNGYTNATLVGAEAQGLTLSLRFRLKEGTSLNVEQYGAQVMTGFCQNPAFRQYTDQYGVVLDINVTAARGSGAHRFQIDRAACARTAGAIAVLPAGQGRLASAPVFPTASGLQVCSIYVGQTVQPQSFANAVARFSGLTPKSEYETTAQFEARQAQALGGSVGPLIIEKTPESRDYFRYDADAQVLHIASFAFDNTNFPAWDAFYSLGLDRRFGVSTGENIDVVIASGDRVTGTYRGQNGFGANASVQQVTRSVKAIFERGPDRSRGHEMLFPGESEIGRLSMTPEDARTLKPSLRIALVVTPFAPYVVRGTNPYGRPSMRSPQEVTIDFTILMADIQCGLVMDNSGRVLGAYPTS